MPRTTSNPGRPGSPQNTRGATQYNSSPYTSNQYGSGAPAPGQQSQYVGGPVSFPGQYWWDAETGMDPSRAFTMALQGEIDESMLGMFMGSGGQQAWLSWQGAQQGQADYNQNIQTGIDTIMGSIPNVDLDPLWRAMRIGGREQAVRGGEAQREAAQQMMAQRGTADSGTALRLESDIGRGVTENITNLNREIGGMEAQSQLQQALFALDATSRAQGMRGQMNFDPWDPGPFFAMQQSDKWNQEWMDMIERMQKESQETAQERLPYDIGMELWPWFYENVIKPAAGKFL